MNNINIFGFGFGQVAKNFINKIKLKNYKINLSTTSTSKTCQKNINGVIYESFFSITNLMISILLKNLKMLIIF